MARPKIAAVVTEHRRRAHAQHFVDRFLWGYPWHGRHHRPPMDLVALYTEALTLGGEKLAVDGVLQIGEHGRYPRNKKGQTL